MNVWRKIAKEVRDKCSIKCGAAQCRYKIGKLRKTYERIKNKHMIIEQAFLFLNEARKAFETTESSGKHKI